MKKRLLLLLAMLICLSAVSASALAAADDVIVRIDGEAVVFDQPPVVFDGRTLVPIRAVCEKLGATVEWDTRTKTAIITKDTTKLMIEIGSQYMQVGDGTEVYLDVPPQIYGERTLLPIRAVAEALGCAVQWDEMDNTVTIEQAGVVAVPALANTQRNYVRNWADVSSVQQFAYKDEGLAYAYIKDGSLEITTPSKQLSLKLQTDDELSALGDVLSDEFGNFYVVWGKENTSDDVIIETVFISKYSPEGQHITTTGFVGESSPWGDDDSAKTKVPFYDGNCVSVIADGILTSYYAKERYDGHQSDNVVAVKTSNMSAYPLPNNTYSGHSFYQSLIYSKITSGLLFASQGDAYARGFRVNDWNGAYGDDNEILFHFYLPPNANYDMRIVNRTFAQLGNLAETSKGVALVGASVKSIGESATAEKQNLFVQIFDPRSNGVSPSMFVGGTTRSGATATDINDNQNSSLTQVTDYGVHWLTNYTDTDVVAPQVVTADDRLVILWATKDDTFFMVLSASGEVLTPATSLDKTPLNSFECPVYYNGAIYWAAANDGWLKVRSIEIK